MPCERCTRPGESCGYAGLGAAAEPCVGGCGTSTIVRSRCGAARRFYCAGPAAAEGAVVQTPIGGRPAPAGREMEWKGAQARRAAHVERAAQPELRAELETAGLDRGLIGQAVVTWNRLFPGLHYQGGHRTALALLNGKLQGTPAAHNPAWLAPMADEPVWSARSWTTPPMTASEAAPLAAEPRLHLAAFDVRGAWLSAAGCDLPAGKPVHVRGARQLGDKAAPGWVRVAQLEGAPYGIQSRWEPGMWMPTPIVGRLVESCHVGMDGAVVWPEYRRWLAPHVEMIRTARTALLGIIAAADEADADAARAVLVVVQGIYQRMFGGLLASERYNRGATLQPVWASMIPAVAQARMFYNLDRVQGNAARLVGIHVDAVWYVLPAGWAAPPGLPISEQLGKFQAKGRVAWTHELAQAWQDGDAETIRKAVAEE